MIFGVQRSTTYITLNQKDCSNSSDVLFKETNVTNEPPIWSKPGNAQSNISTRAMRTNKYLGHDVITEKIFWYTVKCIHINLDTSFHSR